ncbi:MAG: TonB-dependent siderophore receptor [Proteobacteria bacterium]|nr:TonB-dependent siderophore receptor [Pseudomonadota bacterium]
MRNIFKNFFRFKNHQTTLSFCKFLSWQFFLFNFLLSEFLTNSHAFAKNITLDKNTPNSINTLPQITVTAKSDLTTYNSFQSNSSLRLNKALKDTPQSISVVGQAQIRDQNIVNLEEASRYVPSFFVKQGEGNRDQISIRGNDSTADFFIDGARDDMQYFRDFYNIEQVEFMKGPNALAFGRGGSGGLVNRVSKLANGEKIRRAILSGGSFENHRFETDLSDKINQKTAWRFNGVYEKSKTFRDFGNLEKIGLNPTLSYIFSKNTDLKIGYEYFNDQRFNDRGLPSQNGAPLKIRSSKFVGNPDQYNSTNALNSGFAIINHEFNNQLKLKNYTRFTNYDKYYKNAYPNGAVDSSGLFKFSAYDNAQNRNNFTNQTDLTAKFETKNIKHELLLGTEITHQATNLQRKDGYFNGTNNKDIFISIHDDINTSAVDYRLATASKSSVRVLAGFLQDNIAFNKYFEMVAGVRLDNFSITNKNIVSNKKYSSSENLISPKLALILKPQKNISNYVSYSVSYLPSSGDQFSALDAKTKNLKAEKLQNYELGAKWDVSEKFNLTGALFVLDRTNSQANDPSGSGFYVLSGSSRTKGFEASANGEIYKNFNLIAGFSHLDAQITSATTTASKGKKLALTPQNKLSIWGKYNFGEKFSAGLGFIKQSSQFASIDNSVRINGYHRFDGALYYKINPKIRTQINVENIFNKKYYLTGHNNNNLQPGSVRAFKGNLVMDF